jgi:hypothetical protein
MVKNMDPIALKKRFNVFIGRLWQWNVTFLKNGNHWLAQRIGMFNFTLHPIRVKGGIAK